jgi:hypothetical protein
MDSTISLWMFVVLVLDFWGARMVQELWRANHPFLYHVVAYQNGSCKSQMNVCCARSRLIWALLACREVGVPTPIYYHIVVYQNGQYYGLHTLVEDVDAKWLKVRWCILIGQGCNADRKEVMEGQINTAKDVK